MPPSLSVLAGFVGAAASSAVLTALWIQFARRRRLLDLPGARRVHALPTPRGGGLGIAILAVAILAWPAPWASFTVSMPRLAAGVGLFAALGLFDDVRALHALPKFAVQLIAATLMVSAFPLPGSVAWLALAAGVLGCAYLVNAFNFMDGSNGLVACQGLLISLAVAFWPGQPDAIALAAAVLAGACIGFVPFNLPVARCFLGDVGSHAIGAAVFALLALSWTKSVMGLAACLLLLTPVLLDSGYTLLRRAWLRQPIWRAHRQHAYQFAVRAGNSHLAVCLAYATWTAISVGLALAGLSFRSSLVMWALFMLNWAAGTVMYCGMRRYWLTARMRRDATSE